MRSGYEYSNAVVFVSRWNLEYACEHYLDISNKPAIIHYPASTVFTQEPVDVGPRNLILFVGVLDERKNVETLVRALAELRDERLVVCGDGPKRGRIEELCRTLGVDALFCGHVPEEEVSKWIASAKMLVVPSRKEGFAVCYVEHSAVARRLLAPHLMCVSTKRCLVVRWGWHSTLRMRDRGTWLNTSIASDVPNSWRRTIGQLSASVHGLDIEKGVPSATT